MIESALSNDVQTSLPAPNVWGKLSRRWARELISHPRQMLVAFMLTTFDGKDGCFPSIDRLAHECNDMAPTHVYAALRALEKRGFFVRRKDAGRTYYDLARAPKVTAMVTKTDRDGHKKETAVVTHYKVREQTNRSDHEQTEAQAPTSAQEDTISKIIPGSLKRQAYHAPASISSAPRRVRSPREETLYALANWFSQKCLAPFDTSRAEMNAWNWLLTRFGDDEVVVRSVCIEAFERRNELTTDDFPVWGLRTVLFYVKYKRREPTTDDHAKVIKLYVIQAVITNDFADLRNYIGMYGVPDKTVRGIVGEDVYRRINADVYPKAIGRT